MSNLLGIDELAHRGRRDLTNVIVEPRKNIPYSVIAESRPHGLSAQVPCHRRPDIVGGVPRLNARTASYYGWICPA